MTKNSKDKAYWNMVRVLERILTSCNFQHHAPSSTDNLQVVRRATTKSGKIITVIRKSDLT